MNVKKIKIQMKNKLTVPLEQLERHFNQEITILRREKQDFEARLHRQLQTQISLKQRHSQQQSAFKREIALLQKKNLQQSGQILQLQNEFDAQIDFIDTLREHKEMLVKTKELQSHLTGNLQIIQDLERQNQHLRHSNNDLNRQLASFQTGNQVLIKKNTQLQQQIVEMRQQLARIQQAMEQVSELRATLSHECEMFAQQTATAHNREEMLTDEIQNNRRKWQQQRQKRKELQRKLGQIEDKSNREITRLDQQLQLSARAIIQLQTKIDFHILSSLQKDQLIGNLQKQLSDAIAKEKEQKERHQQQLEQLRQYEEKEKGYLQQIESLSVENAKLQTRFRPSEQQRENEGNEMKRQIINGFVSTKMQESKSSGALPSRKGTEEGVLAKIYTDSSSNVQQMKMIELQHQYNTLESTNIQLHSDLKKCSVELEARNNQIVQLRRSAQQWRRSLQTYKEEQTKIESNLRKEHAAQMNQMRSRETEMLEKVSKDEAFQEAAVLKMTFLDKKIKELLENIHRKDQLIDNYKHVRSDLQAKLKTTEQVNAKTIQDYEMSKKIKHQCQRKDQLIKQYKSKIEKLKLQYDTLKGENDHLKKEKLKSDKLADSKQNIIHTLKLKLDQPKEDPQQNEKLKQIQNKMRQDQNKLKQYEAKCKKMSKENEMLMQKLQKIRGAAMQKVKQKANIKTVRKDYEGAKMLGLEASQLQQFMNPAAGMHRTICTQLDILWEGQHFQDFIVQYSSYITH